MNSIDQRKVNKIMWLLPTPNNTWQVTQALYMAPAQIMQNWALRSVER